MDERFEKLLVPTPTPTPMPTPTPLLPSFIPSTCSRLSIVLLEPETFFSFYIEKKEKKKKRLERWVVVVGPTPRSSNFQLIRCWVLTYRKLFFKVSNSMSMFSIPSLGVTGPLYVRVSVAAFTESFSMRQKMMNRNQKFDDRLNQQQLGLESRIQTRCDELPSSSSSTAAASAESAA